VTVQTRKVADDSVCAMDVEMKGTVSAEYMNPLTFPEIADLLVCIPFQLQ
jgi:hypothetical protein